MVTKTAALIGREKVTLMESHSFGGRDMPLFRGLEPDCQLISDLVFPCGLKQALPPHPHPRLGLCSQSSYTEVGLEMTMFGVWGLCWEPSAKESVCLTTLSPPVVGLTASHLRAVGCDSSASNHRWLTVTVTEANSSSVVGCLASILGVLGVISRTENKTSIISIIII